MNFIALPVDIDIVLDDIFEEIHKIVDLETPAHRLITHHEDYLATMNKLAELVLKRLSDDLLSTCEQLGFEPVTFTNPRFYPKEYRFCATSNTDKETLAVLMFTKYWTVMEDHVARVALSPVCACYDSFWYRNFDNNDTFKQQVLALFMPLVDVSEETISVTYTMVLKNQHTVDVPKHIVEKGRYAIVKYFSDLADKGTIDLSCTEFSYDVVRLDDGTVIEE